MDRRHAIVILHLKEEIGHRRVVLNIVCENWYRRPPLLKRAVKTTDCGQELGVTLPKRGTAIKAAIYFRLYNGETDYRGEARGFV
jgi:hypothetical protein